MGDGNFTAGMDDFLSDLDKMINGEESSDNDNEEENNSEIEEIILEEKKDLDNISVEKKNRNSFQEKKSKKKLNVSERESSDLNRESSDLNRANISNSKKILEYKSKYKKSMAIDGVSDADGKIKKSSTRPTARDERKSSDLSSISQTRKGYNSKELSSTKNLPNKKANPKLIRSLKNVVDKSKETFKTKPNIKREDKNLISKNKTNLNGKSDNRKSPINREMIRKGKKDPKDIK